MLYRYTKRLAWKYVDSDNLFIHKHYPIQMTWDDDGTALFDSTLKPQARFSELVILLFPGVEFAI